MHMTIPYHDAVHIGKLSRVGGGGEAWSVTDWRHCRVADGHRPATLVISPSLTEPNVHPGQVSPADLRAKLASARGVASAADLGIRIDYNKLG